MSLSRQSFALDGPDFSDIWDFLTSLQQTGSETWGWDFCRLEWWRYRLHGSKPRTDPAFFSRNVHLWRIDQGKLVAFFLTEADRQDIHLVVHPDHRALEETIFRWAEEQWASGKTQLETYVPCHDTQRQELLARLGYVDGGHSGNLYLFDLLQMDPPSTLAPGFLMEDGTGSIDPLRKIELIKDAFGHTSFERERYDSTFTAPSYNPQLDLTVVTTSGEYVAYCMGWVNSKTLAAAIEPVGVHSAYRRQGLASAIIRECFRRMKGMGAVRCAIGGDSPLYDSLGPEQIISEDRWIKHLRN